MDPRRRLGIVGCGVIGAGWVARFRLSGWLVSVFDPSPMAPRIADEVYANAETAWRALDLGVDDAEIGPVRFCSSVADAVDEAEIVIESVPERLDLKRRTLEAIDRAAGPDTIIASSTSGFRPTILAAELARPERLMVAHPFNPVYLLPLVELVAGERTDDAMMRRAAEVVTEVGMHPLRVRTEIDAHIADRLLEAVWREALWLVNDGVATTAEIDDAIRYGFGLRWAQMGMFETYRIAGGEGGMRHFVAQFGEALTWPWTKLMDTPELTPTLIDRIAEQSDEQSGHLGIRDLERLRDRNLVGILRALEATATGAGATVTAHRQRIASRAAADG